MASDIVGFHAHGGYLGSTVPSYVTEFQFMSAIDSYFTTQFNFPNVQCTFLFLFISCALYCTGILTGR
jgi:hypothetical protein